MTLNVDLVRSAIDRGETGEKVDASDPAAAPLGTDAEAGGTSPTQKELQMATAGQGRTGKPRDFGWQAYLGIVVVLGAAMIAIAALG